jgi:hypothetical protein
MSNLVQRDVDGRCRGLGDVHWFGSPGASAPA